MGVVDSARTAAVRATGAQVAAVPVSAKKLAQRKAAVDKLAGKAVPRAVSGWAADPRTGTVVIKVQTGKHSPAVDAFVARVANAGAVTVEDVAAQAPRTFAAGTVGGDPYYVSNIRCSIGFSVYGGYVTAGHCGRGGVVRGWDGSNQGSSGAGRSPAMTTRGWAPATAGGPCRSYSAGDRRSDRLVRGSWEAPIGSSVCRSGSTTHWHCGTILAKNETVNYGNGQLFYGATKTSVCAEGGDSGGSFITGDQAQGVTSGGWGNAAAAARPGSSPSTRSLQATAHPAHRLAVRTSPSNREIPLTCAYAGQRGSRPSLLTSATLLFPDKQSQLGLVARGTDVTNDPI